MLRSIGLNTVKRAIPHETRTFSTLRKAWTLNVQQTNADYSRENQLLKQQNPGLCTFKRFKHQNKKHVKTVSDGQDEDTSSSEDESTDDEDSEEESSSDEEERNINKFEDLPVYMTTKDTTYRTVVLPSARLDAVAKSLFGTSRKNIELEFYQSKVRLNGELQKKKSILVNEGDEIDLVIGIDDQNPDMLYVRRAYISSTNSVKKGVEVNAAVQKRLLIQNYASPWKPID